MKAKHARRAAILVEALGDLPTIELAGDKPAKGYKRRSLELAITDHEEGGGITGQYLYVDMETGHLIIAAARKIIEEELKKLGVEA